MNCACRNEIDKLLKPKGEQLAVAFSLGPDAKTYLLAKTEKINLGRGKCSLMIVNYCPFCGVKVLK